MFLQGTKRIPIADIVVENRQRTEHDPEHIKTLAESIRKRGLIHPIVVTKDLRLVAGESRLLAHKLLGLEEIDCRFNNTTDPQERAIIELEENLHRKELSWQDQVGAVRRLHAAYCELDPEWTQEKTADVVCLSRNYISEMLRIADEAQSDPTILQAEKMSQARTAIARKGHKAEEALVNSLFGGETPVPAPGPSAYPTGKPSGKVLCTDFIKWSATPQSEKFDFIHCDFPYGVKMQDSGQVSMAAGAYDDDPEIYFALLDAFVKNFSNFAAPVSHVMFWFSMKFYEDTKDALMSIPHAKVLPFPLIWYKSDNNGMLPDQFREGRRVYETALVVSIRDRKVRKTAVPNVCAAPLDKARTHMSRKPPAVLQHFLPMFVESGTRLLDPTCGSGSALQVGKALGADVTGIEMDEKFASEIIL